MFGFFVWLFIFIFRINGSLIMGILYLQWRFAVVLKNCRFDLLKIRRFLHKTFRSVIVSLIATPLQKVSMFWSDLLGNQASDWSISMNGSYMNANFLRFLHLFLSVFYLSCLMDTNIVLSSLCLVLSLFGRVYATVFGSFMYYVCFFIFVMFFFLIMILSFSQKIKMFY